LRGRWLPATVAVALATAAMLALCVWQLDRLAQRRAANALIVARLNEPALRLDGAALDPAAVNLRRAVVRGTFDYEQEIVLRNRTYDGAPGVHLLVPLRISGSEAAVLVDRGWIPFELADAEHRPAFHDAVGEVEVQGILRTSQARRSSLSPADPPLGPDRPRLDAWFRVDLPRIQEQVPYPLLPVFLEEETPAGTAPRWLPRPDPDIQLDEGSHLLYAVQWAAFAGILVAGYAFFFHTRTSSP
jgi:surfeit locus 1 family protein